MNRLVHISAASEAEVIQLAIEARSNLVSETKTAARQSAERVNDLLRPANMNALALEAAYGISFGFIAPVRGNRKAKNRAIQARRGLTFTIEGREGFWKLHGDGIQQPHTLTRMNGAWNGHSANEYERQAKA